MNITDILMASVIFQNSTHTSKSYHPIGPLFMTTTPIPIPYRIIPPTEIKVSHLQIVCLQWWISGFPTIRWSSSARMSILFAIPLQTPSVLLHAETCIQRFVFLNLFLSENMKPNRNFDWTTLRDRIGTCVSSAWQTCIEYHSRRLSALDQRSRFGLLLVQQQKFEVDLSRVL